MSSHGFPISPKVAADRYATGYAGVASMGPDTKTIALAESDGGKFYGASDEEVARALRRRGRGCRHKRAWFADHIRSNQDSSPRTYTA